MTYDTTPHLDQSLVALQSQRAARQQHLEALTEDFLAGTVTMDVLKSATPRLREQLAAVEQQIIDAAGNQLSIPEAQAEYGSYLKHQGPMPPTVDHLTLLRHSIWSWWDVFGVPATVQSYGHGYSDVEGDLAVLLPHLSPEERLRAHCELAAVIPWMIMDYVAGARTSDGEAGDRT